MPYDPIFPQAGTEIDAPSRCAPSSTNQKTSSTRSRRSRRQVDGTNTLPTGSPALVTLEVTDGTFALHFDVPRGSSGSDGGQGPQGIQGEQGLKGVPGEVSFAQFTTAMDGTSSNAVTTLSMAVSDPPPTQAEVQALANKLDELILELRR